MKFEMDSAAAGPSGYYGFSSSEEWSSEQNKLFEHALAQFEQETPDRWERVAGSVPGKTAEDVRKHYELLVEDVDFIEAGRVALPDYAEGSYTPDWLSSDQSAAEFATSSKPPFSVRGPSSKASEQERKKGVPWTEEEHRLFLMGLDKYGKGDWRSISRNFVISRTPTQVASHAQKYFLRLTSGNKEKKRSSIHDITSVGDGDLKQPPLQQASAITNSSMPITVSQSPGFMYPSSMGGAALVNSLGPPTGGNPLMLPPNPHGPYSQKGHSPRHMIPGSTLGVPQMGYPIQPTMHN
ncbi:transcription factor SRM1 [Cryptomeria japonica]|uniref:transcription factor SRM1 n=1 Tax=Cryptomeria japonica TaxID=3369 RepID=UPI0025ACE354|nr:transcription factor SRM1 [Cryptomeria japonica]